MIQTISEEHYQYQFNKKIQSITSLFAAFNPPEPALFRSPIRHYRMRAEFHIWHEGEDLFYTMFDKKTGKLIKLTQFEIGSELINKAMPELLQALKFTPVLRYKLFQVDFLSTLSGQLLITLLYHKAIDERWEQAGQKLRETFLNNGYDIRLVGRAAKQKRCLPVDYVEEILTINGKTLYYKQIENSFTQPNANINIKMLAWLCSLTTYTDSDLLELYCGNGNFCLALAKHFRSILATEISKISVRAALDNITKNQIDNVKISRLSAQEFTQALQGARSFNRLQGIDLHNYDWKTVLVDPPRAGIDTTTLALLSCFKKIIYISCNPGSLQDNLKTLNQTHKIIHIAFFDQFPYTEHIETGVILEKR